MMRKRRKQHPNLYPNWQKKKDSPAKQAKRRDGNVCIDCGVADRTIAKNVEGEIYILYLHAAHVHPLDPDPVEPIDGQRLRARCPKCHGIYEHYWKQRAEPVEQQRRMHQTFNNYRFLFGRFMRQQ